MHTALRIKVIAVVTYVFTCTLTLVLLVGEGAHPLALSAFGWS